MFESLFVSRRFSSTFLGAALLACTALAGCGGGGGGSERAPTVVAPPAPPPPPPATITIDVQLAAGDANCFRGGTRTDTGLDDNGNGTLESGEVDSTTFTCNVAPPNTLENFTRIATFPVCRQQDADCDTDIQRSAEIVDVSQDGNTLVYTDPPRQTLGFVDITDPSNPGAAGTRDLAGTPTSLAVIGNFAIVAVDRPDTTGPDNGSLEVVNLTTRTIVQSFSVAGNPDSVAISPDGTRALVAVENPNTNSSDQPPIPGFLLSLDVSSGTPSDWVQTQINLTGLADVDANDPEPEFVDINGDNIGVVSLQTNNHLVLVDLNTNTVTADFSAGSVNLENVDALEGEIDVISLSQRLVGVVREPDGVAWINTDTFATANEGAELGGGRGFTVFDTAGAVQFEAGNALDHEAARLGHYPDSRSENSGNEPEGAEVGIFGADRYLFIGSERGDLVFVYDVADPTAPISAQTLPTPASPEGIKAIPSRNLLVVAGEEDDRSEDVRSSIAIYEYVVSELTYPTIEAVDRADGTPIPWGALSALTEDPSNATTLYTVEDAAFDANRIFRLDLSETPARLAEDIQLRDDNNILSTLTVSGPGSDRDRFDGNDRDDLTNPDGTVNLDLEGITVATGGGFWVVAEGEGDAENTIFEPIDAINLLIRTDAAGVIQEAIRLPANIEALQETRGFSGVAEADGVLYVTFQRPWGMEANIRIGRYDTATNQWDFIFYSPDAPESQNGGRVSLTDIASIGGGEFRLLESDSQAGPDAAVKRIYTSNLEAASASSLVNKTLFRDLLVEGDLPAGNGTIPNSVEGLAVTPDGRTFIVNDNDGLRSNVGETRLVELD